jgi:hypothetical protein
VLAFPIFHNEFDVVIVCVNWKLDADTPLAGVATEKGESVLAAADLGLLPRLSSRGTECSPVAR